MTTSSMSVWTSADLARATGGSWVGPSPDPVCVERVTYIISGEAGPTPNSLMVLTDADDWPRRRVRRSGQWKYETAEAVRLAAQAGASAVMSSAPITDSPLPVLQVADSRRALWKLADEARRKYPGKVIGVTGTAGKSTTKGMLYHALKGTHRVSASPSNWNTLDSVAMTVASALAAPDFAIVEAAQSGLAPKNEVSAATFVRPHCAVITAIGLGEVKLFPTVDHTARAKAGLIRELEPGGVAIINRDTNCVDYLLQEASGHAARTLTFGEHSAADFRLVDWQLRERKCVVKADVLGECVEFVLPAPGRGMALNALATIAASYAVGLDWRRTMEELASVPVGKRVLEFHNLHAGDGDALLIDDSHNATELSMIAAFEVLQRASSPEGRRIAALGHIVNLGDAAEETHGRLARPLVDCGVDLVFTTGEGLFLLRERLPDRMRGPHLDTPAELAAAVASELRPGDVVLTKGSHRDTGFREVAREIRRSLRKAHGSSSGLPS